MSNHYVVLPLPTLCLASEAKSPKSKSKIENKIFPCLCQKDTRGNLRLPIVFFSPSLWRLINCYAVFVGGFEFWAPQVVLLRGKQLARGNPQIHTAFSYILLHHRSSDHRKWRKWQGCLKSLSKSAIHRKIIAHQEYCLSVWWQHLNTEHCQYYISSSQLHFASAINVTWSSTVALVLGMDMSQNFFRNVGSLFTF